MRTLAGPTAHRSPCTAKTTFRLGWSSGCDGDVSFASRLPFTPFLEIISPLLSPSLPIHSLPCPALPFPFSLSIFVFFFINKGIYWFMEMSSQRTGLIGFQRGLIKGSNNGSMHSSFLLSSSSPYIFGSASIRFPFSGPTWLDKGCSSANPTFLS